VKPLTQLWDYLSTADHWSGPRGLTHGIAEHLRVSVFAVLIAALFALPPALFLGHIRRGGVAANALVNVGRAVPSFAIVSLLFPISLAFHFQLGFLPTLIAMMFLGIPPMFTNTYAGIVGVDHSITDAARGVGMRPRQVLWRAEVPSALPLILTGVRIAAVQIIATATLGALVGFGGLGRFIVEGLTNRSDRGELLAGAVLVAALAVLIDIVLGGVQRAVTPWTRQSGRRVRTGPPDLEPVVQGWSS
jgi:osmoprotectant transport system permease protein